jgi:hypothetical protein
MADKQKWFDLGERTAWTLLQAGIGLEAVALFDLPPWVAVPIAGALAAVKAKFAQKFGNGTGASLPASQEPVFVPGFVDEK